MSSVDVAPRDFNPRHPWWGGDLQTLRNYAFNVTHPLPGKPDQRLIIPLDDGDRLVTSLYLPERGMAKPTVLLIHGIAGCERSCYVAVATVFFRARGYPVLTVNQRGAGPSRPYCRGQYHAGSTRDLAALFDRLPAELTRHGLLPVGFSLGGNVLLKLLGEIGGHAHVRRAASVSAPIDLAASCRSLIRWRNFAYHRYIMVHLKRGCTGPGAALTGDERHAILHAANLWELDDNFTAPRAGHASAEAFYEANSSRHYLDGIRTETLIIHAHDDPFVPATPYLDINWSKHHRLVPSLTKSGGHLGFHDPSGFWHLREIDSFFSQA